MKKIIKLWIFKKSPWMKWQTLPGQHFCTFFLCLALLIYFLYFLMKLIAFFLAVWCLLGFCLCRFLFFHFLGLHYYLNQTQVHKHKEKEEENYLLYLQMSIIHTQKKKKKTEGKKKDKRASKFKVLFILKPISNLKMHICKSQKVLSSTMAKSSSPEVILAKMLMWAGSIL